MATRYTREDIDRLYRVFDSSDGIMFTVILEYLDSPMMINRRINMGYVEDMKTSAVLADRVMDTPQYIINDFVDKHGQRAVDERNIRRYVGTIPYSIVVITVRDPEGYERMFEDIMTISNVVRLSIISLNKNIESPPHPTFKN